MYFEHPFGMHMPGRHGFATESGDWHGSYGYYLPDYLAVNFRSNNTPPEYTARIQVALDNGFSTGASSDNYVVYIIDSAMQATVDSAYQLVANGYRYGFNGQEHDVDNGNGMDSYTALFWEYDSRSGRRWNIDPVPKSSVSNYVVLGNNPISYVDPLGDNWFKNKNGGYDWKDKKGGKTNFWAQGDKKGISVWYGSKNNDIMMSGQLDEVIVTSSKKAPRQDPIRAAFANSMSDFNHSAAEEAAWKVSQDNFRKGNFSSISPSQLKLYQTWKQSEKDWRTMSGVAVGALAFPLAFETGIVAGTDAFLWKMGLDGVGQTIVNGGDISKLDVWDMTLAGFSAPGASAFYGGAIDIRLNGEVNIVGFGKSWQTAALDGTFKYAFGGNGLGRVPGNMLRKVTFSTPLSTLENNIVLRCLSVPINISGKASRKAVKLNTGL